MPECIIRASRYLIDKNLSYVFSIECFRQKSEQNNNSFQLIINKKDSFAFHKTILQFLVDKVCNYYEGYKNSF